jgi:hypothetical protein
LKIFNELFADQPTCLTEEDLKDIESSSDGRSDKSMGSKKKSKNRFKMSDTDINQYSFPMVNENISMPSSPEHSVDGDSDEHFHTAFQKTIRSQSVDRSGKNSLQKLIKLKNSTENPIELQKTRERKSLKLKNDKDSIKMSIINQLPDDVETLKKIHDYLTQLTQ